VNIKLSTSRSLPAGRELKNPAFTLVELVATIFTLGILTLLVFPASAKTQSISKLTLCRNNLKKLTAVWSMYSHDFGGRVANNFTVVDIYQTIQSGRLENWANNLMRWGASTNIDDRSITNTAWAGAFGAYLGSSQKEYHCPSDTYLSPVQREAGFRNRMRSISMNTVFGRSSIFGDSSEKGRNWGFSKYLQYLRTSQVLKPAKTWLLIEEHPDSINDGHFINNPTGDNWQDIPAIFHNGGSSLSFSDGHSELKHWRSPPFPYATVQYTYTKASAFDALGREDFSWYLSRTGWVEANTGELLFGY